MRKFKVGDEVNCIMVKPKKGYNLVVLGYYHSGCDEYVLLGNVYAGHSATGASNCYDHNGNSIGDVRDKSGHYYAKEDELTFKYESIYDRPLSPEECYKVETPKTTLLTNKNNIIKVNQNF